MEGKNQDQILRLKILLAPVSKQNFQYLIRSSHLPWPCFFGSFKFGTGFDSCTNELQKPIGFLLSYLGLMSHAMSKIECVFLEQVDVNGPNTAPVYQFLKSNAGGFLGDVVKWNFEKFLVDKNGKVVERYPPTTSPFQIEVISPIFAIT